VGGGAGGAGNPSGTGGGSMIDEYIIDYEEYPAIGSGGLSYLDGSLYVNTFSVKEYNEAIEAGRMSVGGRTPFSKSDRMRYRFMMQLFGLRLDKRQWEHDFGCSVANGLPAEYLFLKAAGAYAYEDEDKILLTAKGRYLMVALMREFFVGVNNVRDQARATLDGEERTLLFGQ
jgi:coproporphyrinogen III oxidase-like Fe-S oxidoreductase